MAKRILFVDDEANILKSIQRLIKDEPYEALTFDSPLKALKKLEEVQVAVVVSDQYMPEMEGLVFLEKVQEIYPDCVRIIMSGYADLDLSLTAINRGNVYQFICKPWNNEEFKLMIKKAFDHFELVSINKRLLKVNKELLGATKRQNRELKDFNKNLEEQIATRTSEIMRSEDQLEKTVTKLRKAMEGTIHAIALTVEARDPYTAGHQRRVADLAGAIGMEMGLPGEQIEGIRVAGAVHDLGKISVPAEILNRPGKLTDLESSIIHTHSQVGYDILKGIEFPWPIAEVILQHHERIDGSGYPNGLSDQAILLEAKIIAVADVIEAMASNRPFRTARGMDEALKEITKNRGLLYDPAVVKACLTIINEKGFDVV
ncbi:MAG: HD domain-containing phosphohydrolase [Chloroflexota bacterium]